LEAITDVQTHLEVLQKYGLAVYLSLFFSIGIFLFSVWMVKRLLTMHEKEKQQLIASQEREREKHQEFLSEAVKSNTTALIIASDRLSDLGATLKGISESLIRIESANRYQREEHVTLTSLLGDVKKDVTVVSDHIKDVAYRIRDTNKG
jgi:tRNA G18 (ribose-2'-O)-methylase SpoU